MFSRAAHHIPREKGAGRIFIIGFSRSFRIRPGPSTRDLDSAGNLNLCECVERLQNTVRKWEFLPGHGLVYFSMVRRRLSEGQ